jgi:transposase
MSEHPQKLRGLERRAEAYRLHQHGVSVKEIAQRLGVSTAPNAAVLSQRSGDGAGRNPP